MNTKGKRERERQRERERETKTETETEKAGKIDKNRLAGELTNQLRTHAVAETDRHKSSAPRNQ